LRVLLERLQPQMRRVVVLESVDPLRVLQWTEQVRIRRSGAGRLLQPWEQRRS
jgi:hypothetical protein